MRNDWFYFLHPKQSCLIGKGDTADTVTVTEDVQVPGKGDALDVGVHLRVDDPWLESELQDDVVDSGGVQTTGRLGVFWVKGKGVAVDVRLGDVGVMLVRLHETEVRRLPLCKSWQVVELERDGADGVASVLP